MAFMILILLSYVVPILIVVYLVRAVGTLVDGVKSINAGVQRMAKSLEVLTEAERNRTT